jgi:hypothetical protein
MNHSILCGAAALVACFATAACSPATTTTTAPQLQGAAPSTSPCRVTGRPERLATHVFVPGGVQARVLDDGFEVRFAGPGKHCFARLVSSASGPLEAAAPCPIPASEGERLAVSGDETMKARESNAVDGSRIALGVVTYNAPRAYFGFPHEGRATVVEHLFEPPQGGPRAGQTAPALAPIGGERFLLVWIEGGVETEQLRAQPVAGWGKAAGPALDLSLPEGSVIGRPSVAFAPSGDGLVAYVTSMGDEFDVYATPVACAAR